MELPERRRWGKCNELHAAFQSFGKVLISEGVQIGRWRFHVTCWAIKMLAMVTYSNWHPRNHAWFNEPNPHFLLKQAGVSVLIFWYLGEKFHLGIQWEIWSCRYPNVSGFNPKLETSTVSNTSRICQLTGESGPWKIHQFEGGMTEATNDVSCGAIRRPRSLQNHEVETWIPSAKSKVFNMKYFLATLK